MKVLSPVVKGRKGEYHRLFERLLRKGFLRARIDGEWKELEEKIELERMKRHNIEILIDEVEVSLSVRSRLSEAIEKALEMSKA